MHNDNLIFLRFDGIVLLRKVFSGQRGDSEGGEFATPFSRVNGVIKRNSTSILSIAAFGMHYE
jgi:hypothetical protein